MIKKMIVFIITCISFGVLSLQQDNLKVLADTDNQMTINLHHQLSVYESNPVSYTSGSNVTFQLYDLTADYQKYGDDENYFENLKSQNQGIQNYIKDRHMRLLDTETTDTNGQATFHVSKEYGKAYLIVQQKSSQFESDGLSYEQISDPVAFSISNQDIYKNKLDIETKSAIVTRIPYFFKYGQTLDHKEMPLSGVKFVLYKIVDNQKKYLTDDNNWKITDDPLHMKDVKKIVSDSAGLVALNNSKLPAGQYYFQEVQTLKNFDISSQAQHISVNIPAVTSLANVPPITVNGESLSKVAAGVVPGDVYQNASPKVLNYQQKHPTKEPPFNIPFLPETGIAIGSISLIGLLIILSVVLIKIYKKKIRIKKEF
ncbi:SpaA isopeptide-forming pilin-related protein [Leuconostoc sp. MS02]|uniref:SpaA isopeptide-forming pilin-related protein n=1 Tax=Leuconostoc aquikimchii TaxID=3236804 RepID=A0ABV3S3X2_9LACO